VSGSRDGAATESVNPGCNRGQGPRLRGRDGAAAGEGPILSCGANNCDVGLGHAFWRYECTLCDRVDQHNHGLRHSESALTQPLQLHRRIRITPLIVICVSVALVATVVGALLTAGAGDTGMAPPPGFSADQLIFDDHFAGTSLDSSRWNTFMGGQGERVWNSSGLPDGDSAAGTQAHQTYFSPSQVTVNNGLDLAMVPDTTYASMGFGYKSGVVTSGDKFVLRSGYVQIRARMSESSQGGWPAIWFLDPDAGGGSQEIDLQEGGFIPSGAGLPSGTPADNVFVSTYHTPSGSQSDFGYATPTPMNTGFNIYGMEYDPGHFIKTYFDGRLIGSWTHDISTTPYEIVMWNSQASAGTSGYHTTGTSPNPSNMDVDEVQAYSLSP
jgi:beta-glucanase (GH16 family)